MKSVEVRKAANALDVAQQAAEQFIQTLTAVLTKKKFAHVALTGGTVGVLTLEVLAKIVSASQLDTTRIHFWWGDERFVESDSMERNSRQAQVALLETLKLPAQNVHMFPSKSPGLNLQDARDDFEVHIRKSFGSENPAMDLTLLGMGPDGHVASIFPGQTHSGYLVIAVPDSPKPPMQRLSMSLDLINCSEKIIFVVSGIDKADAVEKVHSDPACDLPAAKVSARGLTLWIIDEAAGSSFWSC